MKNWINDLYRELDQWNFDGVTATIWWRDDDARAPSESLANLLQLARANHAPLALAVIPSGLDSSLAKFLETSAADVHVIQHGYAHINHANHDEKKSEFGEHRTATEVQHDLRAGYEILRDTFGARFVPALAPPWNRFSPKWNNELSPAGLTGLSAFGAREKFSPAQNISATNTHVDIINWKGGRGFIGAGTATENLCAHLRQRRRGECSPSEATGLLTHHLAHDAACNDFLRELLAALDEHPAVKWRRAAEIFAPD